MGDVAVTRRDESGAVTRPAVVIVVMVIAVLGAELRLAFGFQCSCLQGERRERGTKRSETDGFELNLSYSPRTFCPNLI